MDQTIPAADLARRIETIAASIATVIVGKDEAIRLAVTGLLAGGHLLIEDIPGVGKTTLAQALARSVAGTFHRIQFTPDLLPSDITGIAVYDQEAKGFSFKPGPLFANFVLADEINRATPRTQSALLEAMEAATVTCDGTTYRLPRPFMVVATQNPIDCAGTYPLPESQLDRFMARIRLDYPSREEERLILQSRRAADPLELVAPVVSGPQVVELCAAVRRVAVGDAVLDYLTAIVERTRSHPRVLLGASPRASLGLQRAAQAFALADGRDYTIPDDVKALAVPVLAHRIVERDRAGPGPGAEAAGDVIREILEETPVPL